MTGAPTLKIAFCALVPLMLLGCQSRTSLSPGEGYVDVNGGKIWYRIVGGGSATPILTLHGGPGFPSYYLNPLAGLSEERPVILFDQLGCGRSGSHTDTTLMTVDAFVEQLEQLRSALRLEEFYLYGHSWGTMLGTEYYYKYPEHVKALILASPALSISRWLEGCSELINTLPDSVKMAIEVNEANGTYDAPGYMEAMNTFYQKYVARKLPWDQNMDSTFAGANLAIYNYMWGPSEFTATGTLKDFERADKLGEIKVPTLFVCGEYDEARPSTVQYFQSMVPNSKFALIKDAAHITMHDNPQGNNEAISGFLREVESK